LFTCRGKERSGFLIPAAANDVRDAGSIGSAWNTADGVTSSGIDTAVAVRDPAPFWKYPAGSILSVEGDPAGDVPPIG
jgi:hypothetical protein